MLFHRLEILNPTFVHLPPARGSVAVDLAVEHQILR